MLHHEAQKRTIAAVAIALTCLLAGLLGGGLAIQNRWSGKVSDVDYLKDRLKRLSPNTQAGPPPAQAALVRVALAREDMIQPERPVVGRLVEVRKTSVSSEVPGTIVAMDVEDGSPVIGGKTVLVKVDGTWTNLAIEKQKARIEAIAAQVKMEEANLRRLAQTLAANVATPQEYEDQAALTEQRRAEMKEAQAQLADLQEQSRRLVIVAPFDGWVTRRYAELGQRLSVGSPVVDIVSRGTIYAEVNVPESIINSMTLGMSVPVRIDPLGRVVAGKLATINPDGASASRTYPVRIAMDDQQGALKVGMSVTAILPVGAKSRQIMVSPDAVLTKPDGSTVWVVAPDGNKDLRARPVPVEIVATAGGLQAVRPVAKSALADNAQVVIEGAERLYPNQSVRILRETADAGAEASAAGTVGASELKAR
jgi:RND family efflux transporter MFP subunit